MLGSRGKLVTVCKAGLDTVVDCMRGSDQANLSLHNGLRSKSGRDDDGVEW